MNKKIMSVLVISAVFLLSAGAVFAYQGNPEVEGPNYSEDRHAAIQEAFDNVDYDTWLVLMSENSGYSRVLQVVTEDNFAIFVEARNAMLSGNSEYAQELKASLGLGQKNGEGNSHSKGQGQGQGTGQQKGMQMNSDCPYVN